ncbi:helix-turn-helix transcriptional regulator [uncultured Flavobacterium sp.]|uniref:helix-turn-helix domain-containing protein n=1 Tax=uncultured Flavobacterium sp. TaxID=165435 RepID=UPI0025FF7720|nr:helix-turn-helix transcriptional regulator [uncultured Flavobacterium sp.]
MSISLRIKELRKRKDISQKDFSNTIRVDNSQFSKIEAGKLQPTLQQLMDICSNFGVTMDWLCFGSNEAETKGKKEDDDESYKELAEARKAIIEYQKEEINQLKMDLERLKNK